jgi:hypothetical protein
MRRRQYNKTTFGDDGAYTSEAPFSFRQVIILSAARPLAVLP